MNREFEWPEQKEKQVVASIKIDDTPWTLSITAYAMITQKDGIVGTGPIVRAALFYEGGSPLASTVWTLTSKDLGDSRWNPEKIIGEIHAHLNKRQIPIPSDIDEEVRKGLNQARKNAFLAMVSGQAHLLIKEVSLEEATSAWGFEEIAMIFCE